MGPSPLNKQFSVSVRCTHVQTLPRKLRWHYCPCGQPQLDTGAARRNAPGAAGLLRIGPLGSGASSPQKTERSPQALPNHLKDEPHQCIPTGSRPLMRTLPPIGGRLAVA